MANELLKTRWLDDNAITTPKVMDDNIIASKVSPSSLGDGLERVGAGSSAKIKVKLKGGSLISDADGMSVGDTGDRHADVTLDGTNVTDGFFDLPEPKSVLVSKGVSMVPEGGPQQVLGKDFEVIDAGDGLVRRVSWTGMGLDGFLEPDEYLMMDYKVDMLSGI